MPVQREVADTRSVPEVGFGVGLGVGLGVGAGVGDMGAAVATPADLSLDSGVYHGTRPMVFM